MVVDEGWMDEWKEEESGANSIVSVYSWYEMIEYARSLRGQLSNSHSIEQHDTWCMRHP